MNTRTGLPVIGIVFAALAVGAITPVQAADYNGYLAGTSRGGVSGPGMAGESPCYAVFHEHADGQGLSIERQGPERVERIRDMHYSDGGTLNHRVMSVTTGPGAVLRLYDASRFRVLMFETGPDSRVTLAHPVMDSYELSCIAPPSPQVYAPGSSYPPPYALPPAYKR